MPWYIAWVDTLSIVVVTGAIVASTAFVDLKRGISGDESAWVTRDVMPCRWAWVYLGRFSPSRGRYELETGFQFAGDSKLHNPIPSAGDEILLTQEHRLIITSYASAQEDHKCDGLLDPPWGYRPETASQFEAGKVKEGTLVVVNQIKLMPSPESEPTFVWALVGPRH